MVNEPRGRRRHGSPYQAAVPIWFSLGLPTLFLVLVVVLVMVLLNQP